MSRDAANTTPWPTDAELPSPEVVARGHLFERWRDESKDGTPRSLPAPDLMANLRASLEAHAAAKIEPDTECSYCLFFAGESTEGHTYNPSRTHLQSHPVTGEAVPIERNAA